MRGPTRSEGGPSETDPTYTIGPPRATRAAVGAAGGLLPSTQNRATQCHVRLARGTKRR
ncbi:hypothetical protein N177_0202 [Lutibaculum baratangense AMV1]|uniref:Uncharacterized protein n=1 Tax=Lutibaculum baratangense AMV1 TaxID=631454 RepID=V4TNC8_9HYPH|nr:hypothetical protein N177_0202 [Lutibaculum baratangense AMV1]